MAEPGDAGGEGAAHIGVDEGHLGGFIVVFVVHVLDQVEHVDIQPGQPVHHHIVLFHHLVVVEILAGDGGVGRAHLLVELFVHTAVDGVEQALGQVRPGAEELHLLAGLGGRDAAADGVVVPPDRLHHVVVFILDRAGLDGDGGGVFLEGLGQGAGVQHGQVGFRRGAHVFQRVEEAEIVLGDHRTAVHADAGHLQRGPDRVAGEQLVVAGDAGKLDHAEFHDQMVDELLGFGLGEGAAVQVPLDVDVQEGGDPPDAHGGAVLGLDGGQVAEVEPLDGFPGVFGRGGDVEAVGSGHLLHALEGADLQGDLLPLADHVVGHGAVAAVVEVLLLPGDEGVDAVQRHAAVVAHDAAAAVGVGQAGDDVAVAGALHLGGVGIKHRGVVGAGVAGEDLVQFFAGLVAVGGACLFGHLDAAVGHEGPLEGLVGLQADDLFLVLEGLVDVAGAVGGQVADHLGLHIQHAALGALGLLQFLQSAPELVGGFGGAGQEGFVPFIGAVVFLDKVADVDFLFPDAAFKPFPLGIIQHRCTSLRCCKRSGLLYVPTRRRRGWVVDCGGPAPGAPGARFCACRKALLQYSGFGRKTVVAMATISVFFRPKEPKVPPFRCGGRRPGVHGTPGPPVRFRLRPNIYAHQPRPTLDGPGHSVHFHFPYAGGSARHPTPSRAAGVDFFFIGLAGVVL